MDLEDFNQIAQLFFFTTGTLFFILIIIIFSIFLSKLSSIEEKIKDMSDSATCMFRKFGEITNNLGFRLINNFFKGRSKDDED